MSLDGSTEMEKRVCVFTHAVPNVNCTDTANRRSLEERVAFVDHHMEDVFDSADHPFDVSGECLLFAW